MGVHASATNRLDEVGAAQAAARVLVVAAAPRASALVAQLDACGHTIELVSVSDPCTARQALEDGDYVAAFTTWPLPDAAVLLREPGRVPVVGLVADVLSDEVLAAAQRLGALLCRSGSGEQLESVLDHALRTARHRAAERARESFDAGQLAVLEDLALGKPLSELLERIILLIERHCSALCSILLLDRDTQRVMHGAAPNLPEGFVRAIDGQKIGPTAGSCGAAAYTGQPVYVRDIATHPNWEPYRALALGHGLRACWSTPILSSEREVLGTFALYYGEPRDPHPGEVAWVLRATHLAAVAIVRRRDERALARSERELRSIFDNSTIGIALLDEATRPLRFNTALAHILHYSPERLREIPLRSLVHPEDQARVARVKAELDAHRHSAAEAEARFVRADGETVWLRVHSTRFNDPEPRSALGVILVEDISERKRLEAAVRAEERLLALIFDAVTDTICYLRVEPGDRYRFVSANRAFCEVFRIELSSLVGKLLEEVVWSTPKEAIIPYYHQAIRERRTVHWEASGEFDPGAGTEYAASAVTPVFDANGVCTNLVVSSRIITEHKRAEAIIAEQAALLDRARDAIVVRSLDQTVRFWNVAAERMYGVSRAQAVGRRIGELVVQDPDVLARAEAEVLAHGAWTGELTYRAPDGGETIVDSSWTLLRDKDGQPESVLTIDTDVTEQKRLEAQIVLAQRMESLGTLAGGIAHDFNNILAAIRGYLEMAVLRLPKPNPAEEPLEVVRTATDRAVDLVHQILTFSRRRPAQRVPCMLRPVIEEVLRLLRATLPRMIQLEAHFEEGAFAVLADATQVHQIIMNLGTNAAQALEGRGHLRIALAPVTLKAPLIGVTTDAPPGEYMRLTVADDGAGMGAETLARIFDPFFTTKAPGVGTGLGLSVVLGIVRDHAGALTVESSVGRGTRFDIYLPRASEAQASSRPPARSHFAHAAGACILCVDDEEDLLALERSYLEGLGYRVEGYTSPLDAERAFAARPKAYAALVTDFAMALMSGLELAGRVRELHPELPIVLVSGFLEPAQRAAAMRAGVSAIVDKPDMLEPLAEALQRCLARGPETARS